jgi:large subunit ribosomal protein L24e
MPKCSFCQASYEFPRGLTLVLNDGKVLHFCSSKCKKNFELGRKSRKVKWIKKMKHTRAELIKEIKEEAAEKEEKKEEEKELKEAQAEADKKAAEEEKKEEAKEKSAEKPEEKKEEKK